MAVLLAGVRVQGAGAQGEAGASAITRQQAEQLRREQRLPEALAAYRVLVERDSGSFEDRFWVAKLESWTGRREVAESAFVGLVEERPDDYDSRIALADVRLWLGRRSAALAILNELHRIHPADPEVLLRLGQVAEAEGHVQEARRYFARVIEIAPEHPGAREALRRLALVAPWEADVEYFGERLPGQASTNGVTVSVANRATDRLRWRAAAAVQEKFDRTEPRFGGELAYRPALPVELQWSAYVAPGAELLPQQTYGLGLAAKVAPGVVLSGDYAFLDFRDAAVHQVGPGLEIYAGRHWLFAGHYRYSSTRFTGTSGAVGNDGGLVALGYLYGPANLLRILAAFGGESFTQPSRELIGQFHAHTIGGSWRHFLGPRLGFELVYAHQERSDDTHQDSYGMRLVQRW